MSCCFYLCEVKGEWWRVGPRRVRCCEGRPVQTTGDQSWRLSEGEPWDLHLALFVRDACGLGNVGPVGPLLESPGFSVEVAESDIPEVSTSWQLWWDSLLGSRIVPPIFAAATMPEQLLVRAQQRAAAALPPDVGHLVHSPALSKLPAAAWEAAFGPWWQRPPSPEAIETGLLTPIDGVRGQLIAAIHAGRRHMLLREVIADLERTVGGPLAPFDFEIELLAVGDLTPVAQSASHAVVPLGLFRDDDRYREWLTNSLKPLV